MSEETWRKLPEEEITVGAKPMRNLKEALAKSVTQTKVNLRKADTEDEVATNTEVQNPFRNLCM